ncbi:NUDIX domain-containing protein [Gordonia jinhuaensis]|uniref:Phosphohydrolase n=1 Tax=Gordonia jinhuaensis TaxID=1517702 RepID=A0A916WTD9_9ACTN|nr:NUDIX domain-containing protein [Gordonia jinhuaensis]GGB28752.1 phosphohydrolase [Gordonia jinhuaensis]
MVAFSAALLLYRETDTGIEVLLGHPGGPFWARKDDGAWSIPKGEYQPDESAWDAARREFEEETGHRPPDGTPIDLGELRQPSGKRIHAYAMCGELDPATATSNTFDLEWPRGSGSFTSFPEIDRVEWFTTGEARSKLVTGQRPFIDRLEEGIT